MAGGLAIFVLDGWAVRIDLLAYRLTHLAVGLPIQQVQLIGQYVDPLANTLRLAGGYNREKCKCNGISENFFLSAHPMPHTEKYETSIPNCTCDG